VGGAAAAASRTPSPWTDVSFGYGDAPVLEGQPHHPPRQHHLPGGRVGQRQVHHRRSGDRPDQPTSGRILVDDVPLRRSIWRLAPHSIGYVPQDNLLLHDSVFANITLGDPPSPRPTSPRP
jgi:ATP-binding cassette, subfamily C, bacterial